MKIRKKIQSTRLFTDAQKIELLVGLPDASRDDIRKLEEGIDAFDYEYAAAMAKHAQQIKSLLGHATKGLTPVKKKMYQNTIDEVHMGLAFLTA